MARPRILIAGAGPAGSFAAALLAEAGAKVVLVEPAAFPRHHVGESLQPAGIQLLEERLGLGEELAAAGFGRKYGAVYVWGRSREPWSVLFDARLDEALPGLDEAGLLAGGFEHAWNVDRATFDHILQRAAVRRGAELWEGARATGVLTHGVGERGLPRVVGLRVRMPDGEEREELAHFVLDATGQGCLIGRSFGLVRPIEDLRFSATYGYFDGAGGVPGALGRHVQYVVTRPEGWVWFIPTSAERTSVGVVHRSGKALGEAEFERVVAEAELPLDGAVAVDEGPRLRHARDWSFVCERAAGAGWALLGDAACFVDPILSGGVEAALRSAASAAVLVERSLTRDGTPAALAASYEDLLQRDFRAYLRLARYWYGHNPSVDGLFWEAARELPAGLGEADTLKRAFVYLTSGRYAADRDLRVFQDWQERRMFEALGADVGLLRKLRRG